MRRASQTPFRYWSSDELRWCRSSLVRMSRWISEDMLADGDWTSGARDVAYPRPLPVFSSDGLSGGRSSLGEYSAASARICWLMGTRS